MIDKTLSVIFLVAEIFWFSFILIVGFCILYFIIKEHKKNIK